MKKARHLLFTSLALGIGQTLYARELPIPWGDATWQLRIDQTSGGLVRIENQNDPLHMNWLRDSGHWERRTWTPDPSAETVTLDGQWGLVETPHTGLLHTAQVRKLSDRAWEAVYTSSALTLTVRRELDANGDLAESYAFKNTGVVALDFPHGSIGFTAPLFDQYPDAKRSLSARCHAHLWMGGNSSWINGMRMGLEPPHLGLVVTQGSLAAYSQRGGMHSDRGVFLLHPPAMKIAPGKSETIAWKLFWHKGWEDFFSRLNATDGFVRLTARNYTVTAGDPLEIVAESAASLESARMLANGQPVPVQVQGGRLVATLPTGKPGEVLVELIDGSRKSWLRANVIAAPDDLLAARVKFIVKNQQRNAKGDPLDGAYLSFDNETGQQVYNAKVPDHNAGRERMAMGVLGALYLPLCQDQAFKAELKESLQRYADFVARELEDDSGVVYQGTGRSQPERLYNYPWAAHFHLAMYRATKDSSHLDRFVRVMRSYYARGGVKFYAIGIPVTGGLKALEEAGRMEERAELLANFRAHADLIVKTGPNYPAFEVNYEQSIVAPSVQLLAEVYLATGEKSYLEELKRQMPLLEAFCGKQPDFRLNEVAIRHWDDFWFGKMRVYGDTFPHYWSTLNAVAYACYGRVTGDRSWFARANAVLAANLSLFDPDGSASCAHVYPLTSNGRPAAKDDPWANDQDWVLVNLLDIRSGIGSAAVESSPQLVELEGGAGGRRFDGIGVVNGGGATSVLLKDYPEPQRSQILDLVYKPKFGASVSALLVEIPGDGNSTQGSMPSHMHTRDDLDYSRGYTWWILREARKRNPSLTLDGAAWSAPGWIGNGIFWSQDAADYYVKWLQGLRQVYGLELDAIGCRNEKGVSLDFAKILRATLDANGFKNVKIHAFDDWPDKKFDFVKDLLTDEAAREAIGMIGAHVLYANKHASAEVQEMASAMGKPIWNTEDHVYKKGFDCAISIVECFNENFIRSGATKVVNWYDIAGVYPIEPYSEDPATVLARSPWSGHYRVREALWGYAHYGQFTEAGWQYLEGGCGELRNGGTVVAMKAPAGGDYSIIIETKDARAPQKISFRTSGGLSPKELCVWRSDAKEQFVRQRDITPSDGAFSITLDPDSIYSLSTTTGQQKGCFDNVPALDPFPFPYCETFDEYTSPALWGHLPRYTADIAGAFEVTDRPDKKGKCIRQVVPIPTISWAPDWLPYTILGDDQWQDYEISADVFLNPGDSAGVMGRISHVGTGYGFIPKGYFLQLGDDGQCRLTVVRGKKDRKAAIGDAEQQALIKAQKDEGGGGEKLLGTIHLPNIGPNRWHNLKLRFEGSTITGFVDEKTVLTATDELYPRGMAGLMAGGGKREISTPYFDNLLIKAINATPPAPSAALPGQSPIYAPSAPGISRY